MTMFTHYVKVQKKGDKAWWFLTPLGGMNRLRIHAARFTLDNANEFIRENQGDNPDFSFKVVPIDPRSRRLT